MNTTQRNNKNPRKAAARRNSVAAAGFAAAGLLAAHGASGATLLATGAQLDGWEVTYPIGITLTAEGGSTLMLHKGAHFDSTEGLDITFTQIPGATSVSPTITILDESVTNATNTSFGAFQFLLANTLSEGAPDAAFDPSHMLSPIAPWTKTIFSPDTITLSGGALAPGQIAHLGGEGSLVIDTHPSPTGLKVLDFKEIPTGSAIPLPAAEWSGLAMLGGLGLVRIVKVARRKLA